MSVIPSTKGVTQDLSSISGVLGTILQQVKDIESHSAGAADGVAGIAGGVGKGGGSGAAFATPTTKTGSGANSVGLGGFSAPASGMSGPEGMSEAKFATSSTKTGMDAFVSQDRAAGSNGGGIPAGLLKGAGYAAAGVAVAGNLMSDALAAMPSVGGVVDRATQYYNAGVANGNQFSRSALESMGTKTGLTYTGQSGQVINYLQQMGVSANNAPDSAFQLQAREITSASRNLNMDPMAAAQAVSGLNSGSQSANLMRSFGIATSDPSTGKMLSMDQIFNQLDERIFPGGRLKGMTKDQVQDSLYRGFLGADLRNSGLSDAQQQIYVQQHLMTKVAGGNTDTSTSASQSQWNAATAAAGNANPQASAQELNASQEALFKSYEQPYLDGIKNATGVIKEVNKYLEKLPDELKATNAFLSTMAGNSAGGAAIKALNDLAAGVGTFLGVLASNGVLKALTGAAGKGGAATGVASDVAAAARTGSKGGAMAAAEDTAVATGGSALTKLLGPTIGMTLADQKIGKGNTAGLPTTPSGNVKLSFQTDAQADYSAKVQAKESALEGKGWSDFGSLMTSNIGSKQSGNAWNNLMKDLGTLFNGSGGASKSDLQKMGVTSHGGSSSSVGTGSSTATQGTIKFILPVNGKITDGFGPRPASATGGIGSTYHRGVDIAAPFGTSIVAGADGTVSAVGVDGSFGTRVMIQHVGGYASIYAHQPSSGPVVRVGQQVKQGQLIGHVGSTGASTGPHCHFEVRLNGTAINPMPLVSGGAVVPITTPDAGTATAGTTQAAPSGTSALMGGAAQSIDSIISSVSDSGANSSAGVSSYAGASSGSSSVGVQSSNNTLGSGPMSSSNKNNNMSMMSVPGAGSFKSGDPYVAADSHVNVHTGEAILNLDEANEWRASKRGGQSKRSAPAEVKIYLSIADASDSQARAFATKVKGYLEEDSLYSNMQSR